MSSSASQGLRRSLGFWALAFYGLGDILGAGIYALMGKVAGAAGVHAWLGFCVSLLAAAITALTYAELVTRFPRSGGEAFYCERGFGSSLVSSTVGFLVFCSGTFSLSTIAVAFAGYLHDWLPHVPGAVVSAAFILALGSVNFWGIRQSSIANIFCTVVEAGGLVVVVVVGVRALLREGSGSTLAPALDFTTVDLAGVMHAGALAFFAFIGFQDMVNVAEEVKQPARNFPRAILTALTLAGITYIVVAMLATSVVDPQTLGESKAPLTRVVRAAGGDRLQAVFPVVALFAVANTGLLNFIMASRLLYGMGHQGLLPAALTHVHTRRRTPHVAIASVLVVALGLALSGSLSYLAGSTSVVLLVVFLVVNLALARLKWREPKGEDRGFRVPAALPWLGAGITAVVMAFSQTRALLTAGALIALGAAVYGATQLRRKCSGP